MSGGSHAKHLLQHWAPLPVLFMLLLAVTRGITAAELIRSEVSYHDGAFSIEIAMDIRAGIDSTREILLDYNQTPRYNDNITSSELLGVSADGKMLGRVVIRDCVLSICRELVQMQEMDRLPTGGVRIHVIPEQSDYRTADYLWRFRRRPEGTTRLLVDAIIAPRIDMPPLIGPWIIARKIKQRLISVVNKLEKLSQHNGRRGN